MTSSSMHLLAMAAASLVNAESNKKDADSSMTTACIQSNAKPEVSTDSIMYLSRGGTEPFLDSSGSIAGQTELVLRSGNKQQQFQVPPMESWQVNTAQASVNIAHITTTPSTEIGRPHQARERSVPFHCNKSIVPEAVAEATAAAAVLSEQPPSSSRSEAAIVVPPTPLMAHFARPLYSRSKTCREYVESMDGDVLFFQGNRATVSLGTKLYLALVQEQAVVFGTTKSRKKKGACKRTIVDCMHRFGSRFLRLDRKKRLHYLLTEEEVLHAISNSLWYASFKIRTTTTTAKTKTAKKAAATTTKTKTTESRSSKDCQKDNNNKCRDDKSSDL